jgi:RimJ/RimL family protein N-acetyltransferase
MMSRLGGPESMEQIHRRHERYLQPSADGSDHMFKIILGSDSEGVGSIGYWKRIWRDQAVYEMGWLVLPAFQRQGIATKAGMAAIAHARREPRYRFMHAFPSIANAASNSICRKLGFTLIEDCRFEYPLGRLMNVHDWRLDLFENPGEAGEP